ncbi:MAG: TIGR04552 family protein [Bacteriovoracaceae bacterium]
MNRPDYLESYKFNWETFEIIAGGKSSLDAKNYLSHFKEPEAAYDFLIGYGFDVSDPVQKAELFGIFQEAIQFTKRYFLKEGNSDGLEVSVPNRFYSINDVKELLLIATNTKKDEKSSIEEMIWAGIILKVMHTILHADKDLRYRYFSTIQTQIFDRFYKFIQRDENDALFLGTGDGVSPIPLVEFDTKAKKTRESIIIKLLHKQENVAEELFDRIGVRFVTKTKIDALRVLKFLYQNYIVMVNNIKPSRSHNSLVDMDCFKKGYFETLKKSLKEDLNEGEFAQRMEALAESCSGAAKSDAENLHTSSEYKAIHFTSRQLIKYRNPFLKQFSEARKLAKNDEESELAKTILSLDTSSIARDVRFFYPYEVQITDIASHLRNTEGEASHIEYKKSQLHSAMKRLFRPLIEYKDIKL